jgi:hypothetical protein
LMAAYAFVASVLTLFLTVIFVLRPRVHTGLPVLVGSLAILCFTGAWIAFPSMRLVTPKLGLDWPFNVYSILYGAYVTLVGAITAFIASIGQLYVTVRKPIRNLLHLKNLSQTSDVDLPS